MNRFPNVSLLFLSAFYLVGDGVTTYAILDSGDAAPDVHEIAAFVRVAAIAAVRTPEQAGRFDRYRDGATVL